MRRTALPFAVLIVAATAPSIDRSATRLDAPPTPFDTLFTKGLKWRSIGPDRGGRSIAVSGVRGRPNEAYFGAVGGGLWKTTDGGNTWAPVTDGQVHSASVGAVAVSETNPDVVYIGMGESAIRGNIMPGDGVYKSTDAGKTWKHIGFASSENISKIRIDPRNPDVVFVAAFGKHSAPNPDRGVFKSTDGGATWRKVLFRNDSTGAIDVSIDRTNPNVVYAALWQAYRKEYTMSSGGAGSGLFKSTDGGETWTEITRNPGLPSGLIGRIGVAVSGANPNRVYALVENANGGLFRSDDAGATWTLVNSDHRIRQRAFYYTNVHADPANQDVVYMQNTSDFRSTDGGKTLVNVQAPHGDHHDFWIDPDNSRHVIDGNDGGGTVSMNGGLTWTDIDFPTPQFYHVATTAHVPYHVCGAQQDNSTLCVPGDWNLRFSFFAPRPSPARDSAMKANGVASEPTHGGMTVAYDAAGGEPGYIAPDPRNPDLYFSGTNNGGFLDRYDRRTGNTQEVNPYPWMYSGEPASAIPERWQWTYPIVFSQADPRVLYVGSQHLWKTTDRGRTWTRISPDLTRHDPKTMGHSGGDITGDMNGPEIYAVIFSIGPSKRDVNVVWAGSDDGLVHVTRDGGGTWTNVTPKDMPDFGRVSQIDASAFDAATAYVSVRRPLLDDHSPYIWRTHDYGRTWTKIVNGIRADDWVHAVREDPTRRGMLYAATQHGVYVSYDDGDNWRSLSLNLPDAPVSDLVVKDNDLVISTHGRGFYVLDNIQPLRGWTEGMTSNDVTLFTPGTTSRGTNGISIAWYLKAPARRVALDILDSTGAVIRSFPSDTTTPRDSTKRDSTLVKKDSTTPDDDFFGPRVTHPSRAAGLNRLNWDLTYEPAVSFPKMILWGAGTQGPTALPGRYSARLTVDGRTYTKPIVVTRNPMLADVSDADLRAQFDLGIKVRNKLTEADSAVIRARELNRQITDRVSKASDATLKTTGTRIADTVSDIESHIYQVKNQSGQDPLNFPIQINNRIADLGRVVNSGEGRPTASAATLFTEYSKILAVQTTRFQRVLSTDLPSFNAQLSKAGLPVIDCCGVRPPLVP
jgi:photosystem II stability/assembly factor-like uncharacterized protein